MLTKPFIAPSLSRRISGTKRGGHGSISAGLSASVRIAFLPFCCFSFLMARCCLINDSVCECMFPVDLKKLSSLITECHSHHVLMWGLSGALFFVSSPQMMICYFWLCSTVEKYSSLVLSMETGAFQPITAVQTDMCLGCERLSYQPSSYMFCTGWIILASFPSFSLQASYTSYTVIY